MVLQMTRPTRRGDSSFHWFRRRVPPDVAKRERGRKVALGFPAPEAEGAATVTVTVGSVIKFSLRTGDAETAKVRTGLALVKLNAAWEAIRRGPREVPHKQGVALARWRSSIANRSDLAGSEPNGLIGVYKGGRRGAITGELHSHD
jgi:hypothetical protein